MSPVHAVQTMHEHNVNIKIYIQSKLKVAMKRTFQQQTSHVQDIRKYIFIRDQTEFHHFQTCIVHILLLSNV